ncbi:hypothetical protein SOVF_020290 [Spinacia oleracea]|nr:hypothetical protein SOVF_020290 [Spinacia oleracea]
MSCKAMCKMLLSLEDENEVYMLQNDVSCVCQGMLAFPLKFPWTAFSKGLQARNRIMKMLEKMIQERRARRHSTVIHDSKDFLQCLVVGQDTTGSAMSWMVKYLDDNQEVLKALQVVKESLRMASIVPWFPRIALHDCNILGYTIKKGWNINVDARSIHCDPTLYRNPHKFDPSRFDNEAKAYSYLAFGVGGRTCLGTNLARIMMLVFLYRLLTAYKWEVTDPDSSVESWALFSRLKTGCPIRITQVYNQTN